MASVFPRLVLNLKAYPSAIGRKAVGLAKIAVAIEEAYRVPVAVCPQPVDVRACVDAGARVYAQHFDRVEKPEATGWLSPEAFREAGCEGTLLNHSEHRQSIDDLKWCLGRARELKLRSILCTRDSAESETLARYGPDLVAVEPPELIGGDVSITSADPDVVSRSVAAVRRVSAKIPVLCGAGVKRALDVQKAVELGAHGILVASGVTRAKEPRSVLADLASGFGRRRRNNS